MPARHSSEKNLLKGVRAPESMADNGLQLAGWEDLLKHWQDQLDVLAQDFVSGRAMVSPVNYKQACRFCDLKSLCRIAEAEEGATG